MEVSVDTENLSPAHAPLSWGINSPYQPQPTTIFRGYNFYYPYKNRQIILYYFDGTFLNAIYILNPKIMQNIFKIKYSNRFSFTQKYHYKPLSLGFIWLVSKWKLVRSWYSHINRIKKLASLLNYVFKNDELSFINCFRNLFTCFLEFLLLLIFTLDFGV